jgi:hypothetical protein
MYLLCKKMNMEFLFQNMELIYSFKYYNTSTNFWSGTP